MDGNAAHVRFSGAAGAVRPHRRALYCALALASAGLLLNSARLYAAGAITIATRANAPEVVLDHRAGSDVVCIMAAVNAGSSCEGNDARGATHFIEHMAFDGSERYTREEISGWVDDVGGFLNAFTRKETTVFFLLVPSVHLEKGVEILSQMLLHSVFLPQEIEKERKVILEEIRREHDDPRSALEGIIDRCLYRGSLLTEPIIGYPATIETMSESALKEFYRRHYRPSNMRIVLTGSFDPTTVERLIDEYFPAGAAAGSCGPSAPPQWSNGISVRSNAGAEPGFDILVPFPSVGDGGFPAALLVAKMLEGEGSPLAKRLASLSFPAPETRLEIHRGFSALRVHIGPGEGGSGDYRGIPAALESLADWTPSAAELNEARVSYLSGEMFDREMYHFYVMSRGDAIALHGERFLSQSDAAATVTAKDCAHVIRRAFRPLRFNACLIEKEGSRSAASEQSLAQAPPAPQGPGAHASARGSRAPGIEVLPNGCTTAAIERAESPVAALHILLKGRACSEAAGTRGQAEILMTLLESSEAGRALSARLEALGARLQFGDNPYVPQDDYLLSPAFAFVRLEAGAGSIIEAASLVVDHCLSSAITAGDLDEVKGSLTREVGMRSASGLSMMRNTMWASLLGGHPFGAPLFPAPPAIMRAGLDELQALRGRLFAGGNMIATLVSPRTPTEGCEILKRLFSGVPHGPAVACPSLPDSVGVASIAEGTRKETAYVAAGWLGRSPGLAGTASYLVAGEALSRRMQLELREKQGLAYSIDCSVVPLPGGAVIIAYLGTGAQKLEGASAALEREVRGLREAPPDSAEVETAKNRLLGRRARSELSSINAAYMLGFDLLLEGGGELRRMNASIAGVSTEDVHRAVEEVLSWDAATKVRLVPEAPGR